LAKNPKKQLEEVFKEHTNTSCGHAVGLPIINNKKHHRNSKDIIQTIGASEE
jgi:hypothetical protein